MTQRNIILSILLTAVLLLTIWGGSELSFWLLSRNDNTSTSTVSTTVNPHAKISGEGNPLPSEAREDVFIEFTDSSVDTDYGTARILYDYETGDYEIAANDTFGLLNIVHTNEKYYIYNPDTQSWYEISEQEAKDFFNIETVYFSQAMVDDFLRSAAFIGESECGTYVCAGWQAIYGDETTDTLTIRVENGSRKIYDINGIGQDSSFTLRYTYQDVIIDPPSPIEEDLE